MKYLLILSLFFSFSFASQDKSLLVKENYVYFKFIEDLIKEKRYSKEQIKQILASKQRTVTSNLLKAINYDFNKRDIVSAAKLYDEIITKVPHKIKNTTEAIYISDYLLRVKKYDTIPKILDINYCESLLNKRKEGRCAYYIYLAKNKINVSSKKEEKVLKKHKNLWEIAK